MLTQQELYFYESRIKDPRNHLCGKYVVGVNNDKAVLALSSEDSMHVKIINEATQELFGEKWTTSDHPTFSSPLAGCHIGGGKYRFDPETEQIYLFDYSGTFGLPEDGWFDEPTDQIIKREIESYRLALESE